MTRRPPNLKQFQALGGALEAYLLECGDLVVGPKLHLARIMSCKPNGVAFLHHARHNYLYKGTLHLHTLSEGGCCVAERVVALVGLKRRVAFAIHRWMGLTSEILITSWRDRTHTFMSVFAGMSASVGEEIQIISQEVDFFDSAGPRLRDFLSVGYGLLRIR